MIPNLYIGNGCFTNGCLGFQVVKQYKKQGSLTWFFAAPANKPWSLDGGSAPQENCRSRHLEKKLPEVPSNHKMVKTFNTKCQKCQEFLTHHPDIWFSSLSCPPVSPDWNIPRLLPHNLLRYIVHLHMSKRCRNVSWSKCFQENSRSRPIQITIHICQPSWDHPRSELRMWPCKAFVIGLAWLC